ncbi:MAG: BamA/TamA family outer membrane protein, partial [Balneolaceae bacterium]
EDKVWQVQLEGNDMYSDMVLKDIIATERPSFFRKILGRTDNYVLRETEIRRDAIRISRYYQRRGYDQVQVNHRIEEVRKEWQKRVVFEISEGEPLRISELEVDIDGTEENREILRNSREYRLARETHSYRQGNRYQLVRQTDVEALFMEAMEESGFAYAEVEFHAETDTLAREVSLRIVNIPGPRKTFTSFDVSGNLSVDEDLVIRETGIEEGDTYSRSRMQTAQRELFNHHLFRFATVSIPDEPTDSTLALSVRIREHPQRSFETTIGFGREELLRGQLTWQHRNVRTWGHRFRATGRASFIEQQLGVDYMIPYVFNTRSSFVSSPYGQHLVEPAFELFRIGFSNSLIYQHNRRTTGSVSYELTYNSELSGGGEISLPDTVLNYNAASVTVSGFYNSSTFRGSEGWLLQPLLEFSSLFGEGTFRYQKASLDVRRYTELSGSLLLANRIQGGILLSGEEESLPATIRYFAGGTNSVRGWNRQDLGPKATVLDSDGNFLRYIPIGGRSMLNFNIELRQSLASLIRGVGLAVFLDGGQVWRSLDDLSQRSLQFGTGGGIRYESPIGPVRVDVGYKINPTDEDLRRYNGQEHGSAFNRFGFHFSIGQAF